MYEHTIKTVSIESCKLICQNMPGSSVSIIDDNMGSEYIITVFNNKSGEDMVAELRQSGCTYYHKIVTTLVQQ